MTIAREQGCSNKKIPKTKKQTNKQKNKKNEQIGQL
jgi:hypothetical protein